MTPSRVLFFQKMIFFFGQGQEGGGIFCIYILRVFLCVVCLRKQKCFYAYSTKKKNRRRPLFFCCGCVVSCCKIRDMVSFLNLFFLNFFYSFFLLIFQIIRCSVAYIADWCL